MTIRLWNATRASLAACAAVLSLSGCASNGGTAHIPPAATPVVVGTTYQPLVRENTAYVSYVEGIARRRGVIVQWVNKPVKREPGRQ